MKKLPLFENFSEWTDAQIRASILSWIDRRFHEDPEEGQYTFDWDANRHYLNVTDPDGNPAGGYSYGDLKSQNGLGLLPDSLKQGFRLFEEFGDVKVITIDSEDHEMNSTVADAMSNLVKYLASNTEQHDTLYTTLEPHHKVIFNGTELGGMDVMDNL